MMYTRETPKYTPEQIEEIVQALEGEQRRGTETRYWEDVEVGEELPPIVLPPFTLHAAEVGPAGCTCLEGHR
jgi:hypothetical protein